MDYFELIDGLNDELVFNEDEIRLNPEKTDWWTISTHLNEIPLEFIREFRDKIMWERVNFKKFKSTEFNKEAEKRINAFNELTQNNSTLFSFIFEPQLDNKDREIIINLSK